MGAPKPYQPPQLTQLEPAEVIRRLVASMDPHEVIRRLSATPAPPKTNEQRVHELLEKFRERFGEHQLERFAESWFQQSQDERRARRRVVIELAVALDAIRKVSGFATGLGEAAIESVIEGDWRAVDEWATDFTFAHERDELRDRYAPLWAPFVAILRAELRRRDTN
jgi:sugar phosphate isomerase/epimerase